jgi:hypothetical protein
MTKCVLVIERKQDLTLLHHCDPLPISLNACKETVCLRPGERPADAPRLCTAFAPRDSCTPMSWRALTNC